MKRIFIVILSVIVVTALALMAPPINFSASSQKTASTPTQLSSNLPAPSPSPFLKIDSSSDLVKESQKLNIPDFQSDYDSLDKTVSGL